MDWNAKAPLTTSDGAGGSPVGGDLESLLFRIATVHHRSCVESAQLALSLSRRLARGGEPILGTVAELVETLVIELHAHVEREDRGVLSRVRVLVRPSPADRPRPSQARPGELERAMHAMTLDHQATAMLFAELRARTGTYRAPAHASHLWRGLYELIEELEAAFGLAVHDEEQLFFPLVRELEADTWA